MLLPIPFEPNWKKIRENRQAEINRNNERENRSRIAHDYKVGDKVMYTIPRKQSKLRKPREGPYTVLRVNNNGTLLIRRGAIDETINIRKIAPFRE